MNCIQLPNDVQNEGYRQTGSFQWEQIFSSKSNNFVGTEKEFIKAGLGYEYIELDKYTRRVVS